MLPVSRVAAIAISKNLVANCARTTSVAFIHHDKTIGMGDKSDQMKMSTENKPHHEEAMRQKAKHVTQNVTDQGMGKNIEDLKDTIGDKVYQAKEAVKGAFENVANEAKSAFKGNDLSEKAENVKEKVEEKVHQAANYYNRTDANKKVEDVKEKVDEKIHQAKDYYNRTDANKKVEDVKEKVDEKIHQAKDYYNQTSTERKMEDAKGVVYEKAQQLKDSLGGSSIGDKVSEMGHKLGEKTQQVKEAVQDKFQQAKEAVGEKVSQAKEAVEEKVDELKTRIGAKEIKSNPEEFVPHHEVAADSYFDDIHDIDRIRAKAEHLTNEQLTDLLRREMQLSRQPKDAEMKKEMQKRSKLSDPDPEQFVPRKDIEDNKYMDDIHDTGRMQMKRDGLLNSSLEEILREELRKRNLPEPDPEKFQAHMEVAENRYFDDMHNVDDMKIKAERLDKEMEGLRKDLASRDLSPMEEVEEESELARKAAKKMDPFLKEQKLGEGRSQYRK